MAINHYDNIGPAGLPLVCLFKVLYYIYIFQLSSDFNKKWYGRHVHLLFPTDSQNFKKRPTLK